jgi:ligand-binding SRPBCC domain-containing protein
MKFGPLRMPWTVRHSDYVEGKQFCDFQIKGVFSSRSHTHIRTFGIRFMLGNTGLKGHR